MSRAFVKEPDGGAALEPLPDRAISPHPNIVTPDGLALIDSHLDDVIVERARPRRDLGDFPGELMLARQTFRGGVNANLMDDHAMATISASELPARTTSPSSLPSSACATGET